MPQRLWICIIRKITFMCETQTFKHTRKPYRHHLTLYYDNSSYIQLSRVCEPKYQFTYDYS